MMHIAYPPISGKFINFFPPSFCKIDQFPVFHLFLPNLRFCLIYVLLIPLFWPCCIYESCFKLSGRPCMAKKFHISRRFRYTFLDLTVKKYEINKSPKCAPFRMKCSKSRRFLWLRPRVWQIFENRGEIWNRGEMHHGLRGDGRPCQ